MVVGKLVHLTVDALLITTILAAIKKDTGYTPNLDSLESGYTKTSIESLLGAGEMVLRTGTGFAVTGDWFKKSTPP